MKTSVLKFSDLISLISGIPTALELLVSIPSVQAREDDDPVPQLGQPKTRAREKDALRQIKKTSHE